MRFLRIQTNRAKIIKLINDFQSLHIKGEFFIAPRPLPKHSFRYYLAYAYIYDNLDAGSCFDNIKNTSSLSEGEFLNILMSMEYFWFAGDKESYDEVIVSKTFSTDFPK